VWVMDISTKHASHWWSRLALPLLFVASFTLTTLAIWPETEAGTRTAAIQPNTLAPKVTGAAPAESDARPATATTLEDGDPPVTAAPTLQELAAYGDLETRTEAHALLNALNEEAAADNP
jgi:hypothetical protein